MSSSLSRKSAPSTTSTHNGWPDEVSTTGYFAQTPPRSHTLNKLESSLVLEGPLQARSMAGAHRIKSVHSTTSTHDGWLDDLSDIGFPTAFRDKGLMFPLVLEDTSHIGNFPPSRASSTHGSDRPRNPLFASQSGRPTMPISPSSPLSSSAYGSPRHRAPVFDARSVQYDTSLPTDQDVQYGINIRSTTPVDRSAFQTPSIHESNRSRILHFAPRNLQYCANSRSATPITHSSSSSHSVLNSTTMIPRAQEEYRTSSTRSHSVNNMSLAGRQAETHPSPNITITTTTTITGLPQSSYNAALFAAPAAPPPAGVVVHLLNEGGFPESQHHADPMAWSQSAIESPSGSTQSEADFNTVPSEYGGAKLQRARRHKPAAKGHRVRHESQCAPSQVGPHIDIHVTAPAARPLDRHPHLLSKPRPDRRRSRSSSDLEALARADGYSRYAVAAHESAVAINSKGTETERKKLANGLNMANKFQKLFKIKQKVAKRFPPEDFCE